MSTIVSIEEKQGSNSEFRVLTKGAPEIIRKFLKQVPINYDQSYLKYVKNGARVLALAYKNLNRAPAEQFVTMKRDEAESELTFCGFLISECPLKPDTKRVIKELKDSRHHVKMITGDNQLTAAYIGRELSFGPKDASLFATSTSNKEINWLDADEKLITKTSSHSEVQKLSEAYQLCINGDILDIISTNKDISKILKHIHIFSRTSPN